MMGVRTPSGAPALVATLPPRRLPKSVHFSMATSVHFSVAIDTGVPIVVFWDSSVASVPHSSFGRSVVIRPL